MLYLEGEAVQRDQALVSIDFRLQESSTVYWLSIRMNRPSKSCLRSLQLRHGAPGKPSHLLNQVRIFVVRDIQDPSVWRPPFLTSSWADWCWSLSFNSDPASPGWDQVPPLCTVHACHSALFRSWSAVLTHLSVYGPSCFCAAGPPDFFHPLLQSTHALSGCHMNEH